jgi:hypothetical protein
MSGPGCCLSHACGETTIAYTAMLPLIAVQVIVEQQEGRNYLSLCWLSCLHYNV